MELGIRNAECGKKKKSEFGSQEIKHSVERTEVRRRKTEVRGRRSEDMEGGIRNVGGWYMRKISIYKLQIFGY